MAEDIQQLIISPNSNLLAILTAHTVHICVLPDSSNLTSGETEALKPSMFTLGPTIHVTSRSPIMSALWHPLGVNGTCLVTVTADAIVRVWEVSLTDRWSFDQPTTSVDLKKLADGMNLEQDFSASDQTTNTGFSPDSFDMEVASACFAGRGSGGWNPMTLWLAMRGGDTYALCPLLPQKWSPPPTLIPSLSVSIVTTVGSQEDDPDVTENEKLLAQQQLEWMGELDSQEPAMVEGPPGYPYVEVYTRPSRPGSIPRLQGPLDLEADPDSGDDLDTSITDILVIGKKTETDDLMFGEENDLEMDDGDQEGCSLAVVCLLSTSGQVRIYLDLEGVQAQWLPPKNKVRGRMLADVDPPALMAFQAIDTMSPLEVTEGSWPVFSKDAMSRYSFYVTHHAAITYLDLAPWIFRLEGELSGGYEAGTDFRVGLVVSSQSARERIFSQPSADVNVPLTAAVVVRDPDVGYFLLSATPHGPITITFDAPEMDIAPVNIKQESPVYERQSVSVVAPPPPPPPALDFHEPRPVYTPSYAFDQRSVVPELLERIRSSRHKTIVNQEIRLSPLTLHLFTDIHKVLSEETYRLGSAASDVFKRCEILQRELQAQVSSANTLRNKVEAINGSHGGESDKVRLGKRITEARERQERMYRRMEQLRKTVNKAATKELSAKEKAYVEEVKSIEANVGRPSTEGEDGKGDATQLWKRLEDAKGLQEDLMDEIDALNKRAGSEGNLASEPRIPSDIRRAKLNQVQGLLERESALVEAVTARLERLQAM